MWLRGVCAAGKTQWDANSSDSVVFRAGDIDAGQTEELIALSSEF